ncbi:UbiA prenyltransferase family-domain-containing protein [Camillea tinctor]|nr:UbiA prenyltransferase family-domain-containing protein [Camillea tinctor]
MDHTSHQPNLSRHSQASIIMSDTQWGKRRWYDILPLFCVPYMELCHISTPAPIFLIYFPHLYGAIYAATVQETPLADFLHVCMVLFAGTVFFSNAAHAWNDIIDVPIDSIILRTKNRPIPRGAITPSTATVFMFSQACSAAVFLFVIRSRDTALCTVPTIVGTAYYPFAKRHTFFPQVMLGFYLAWGVIVGASAGLGRQAIEGPALCLVFACISWTMIYDTMYAYMDLQEDLRVGVKSTAVFFQANTKTFLWLMLGSMLSSLVLFGCWSGMGSSFYTISLGGCLMSQSLMIKRVDLEMPESCWWWFSNGFWAAGASITAGLVTEYLRRLSYRE